VTPPRTSQQETRQAQGRGAAGSSSVPPHVVVTCPLCGADDYHVRLHDRFGAGTLDPQVHYTSTSSAFGQHGRIVECRSCGMVYMNPRPHHQKVQDSYGEVRDERYLEEEQGRVETFTESLELVAGFAPGRRLLDVGCHVGTFLEIAEQAGFDVAGVEPSRWAADVARKRISGTVHCGAVEDAPLPDGGYDVVTMWDVVEHLPDPALDLRAVYHALRPGGIFSLSTMDVDALFPRVAGSRWPWYMQMHLVYFSRRTLAEMLRREGFHIVDVRAHVRRVRLSYLASRLDAYVPPAARALGAVLDRSGLATKTVGVNLGDIFTITARRPERTP
jgi:2-polyprenyl-3-methyl-5-hydroxy-6-metoxy-1,4-benzoquinol methylase